MTFRVTVTYRDRFVVEADAADPRAVEHTVKAHPRVFGAQALRVAAASTDEQQPPDYIVRDGALVDTRTGVPAVCDCPRWGTT